LEEIVINQYDTPVVIEGSTAKILVGDILYNIDTFFLALEYTNLEYDEAIERLGYINE
tara:strand:+ start:798 stop:971 length:174 start_codon:yes stop_codon:yes gene_type:complete